MTTVKLPEYGPEPIKITSAVVELIANGIQIGNPAAAKALARELIELKAENTRLKKPISEDEWNAAWGKDLQTRSNMEARRSAEVIIASRAGKEQDNV